MSERTYEERLRLALYEAAEVLESLAVSEETSATLLARVSHMRDLAAEGPAIIGPLSAIAYPHEK